MHDYISTRLIKFSTTELGNPDQATTDLKWEMGNPEWSSLTFGQNSLVRGAVSVASQLQFLFDVLPNCNCPNFTH